MIPGMKVTVWGLAGTPYRDMHDILRLIKLYSGRLVYQWGGLFPDSEMLKLLVGNYDYVLIDLGSNVDCSETVESLVNIARGKNTVFGIFCEHPRNERSMASMCSLAKSFKCCKVQTSWYAQLLAHHPQTFQDIARVMGNHFFWGEGDGASFEKALSSELDLRMKALNEAYLYFLKLETGGAPRGNMLTGFLGIAIVIASVITGSFSIR
jgi:hypothetical protein